MSDHHHALLTTARRNPFDNTDDVKLPSGQCRFILLNPGIKGQRCPCVGFTRTQNVPGATCECGHMSCYHIKTPETVPDKTELDLLRRRVQQLEQQLSNDKQQQLEADTARLERRMADFEEQAERDKEEARQDLKACYKNVSRVWESVDHVERRQTAESAHLAAYDERLDDLENWLQKVNDQVKDFNEASISLEERVEELEEAPYLSPRSNPRLSHSLPRGMDLRDDSGDSVPTEKDGALKDWPVQKSLLSPEEPLGRPIAAPASQEWTVHVSLLPAETQPFPFEKDTTAYKRCLSRGLHQMVAISGPDSQSFVKVVSKAFDRVLQGREWAPLQTRLCDAETLQGLPMLRPLDRSRVGRDNYDFDFLREHCAVSGPDGKVESLYIAMVADTLSWRFLRSCPVSLEGLEASWQYDAVLDRNDKAGSENAPSAGDMLTPLPPAIKRTASASFGSSAQCSRDSGNGSSSSSSSSSSNNGSGNNSGGLEGPRAKVQRTAFMTVPMAITTRHGVKGRVETS